MSTKFLNTKILIILFTIISSSKALKVKINGRQKDYCFTKSIYENEDTMKIFFLISSGRTEQLNVTFKNKEGKILYQEVTRQRGEYQTDVLPQGDYTLCFSPRTSNQYYISFDMQLSSDSAVTKDLAKDKEVKGIKNGVLDLEKLFNDFEKNLKFIVDRRNHHHTILQDIVGSIKIISGIKILIIILLSIFQVFIITKFFGTNKRVSTIGPRDSKDFL
jgi:hypothetical protein